MGHRNSDDLRQHVSVPPPQAAESVSQHAISLAALPSFSPKYRLHWPPSSRALTLAPLASSASMIPWNFPTRELHGPPFQGTAAGRLAVGGCCRGG